MKNNNSTISGSAVDDEFKAVRTIMDAVAKNWSRLAPDTRVWVKSRLEKLPTDQVIRTDADRERT